MAVASLENVNLYVLHCPEKPGWTPPSVLENLQFKVLETMWFHENAVTPAFGATQMAKFTCQVPQGEQIGGSHKTSR